MSATGHEFPFQSLQESWELFRADVLSDAGEDKQRAMHNAFFVGASTTYLLLFKALKTSNKLESKALVQALFEELDNFMMDEFGEMVRTEGNA